MGKSVRCIVFVSLKVFFFFLLNKYWVGQKVHLAFFTHKMALVMLLVVV